MRIQYASDLHLDLWQKKPFNEVLEPRAPTLVFLGDIAKQNDPNLRAFLEYCSERWKQIFWVPGDEEIWLTSNEAQSLYNLKQLCIPYINIKVLYKETYLLQEDDEKILLVGIPLWYKPRDGTMLHYHNNIFIKPTPSIVDPKILYESHTKQVEFLEYVIKNAQAPIVVLSYYPPFTWMYEEDWLQEPKSALIDRELEKLITYPIISWFVGHNHLPIEYSRRYYDTTGYQGSVLFVSNPRGKPKQNPYYRTEAVLRLQPKLLEGFEDVEEEVLPEWVRKNLKSNIF